MHCWNYSWSLGMLKCSLQTTSRWNCEALHSSHLNGISPSRSPNVNQREIIWLLFHVLRIELKNVYWSNGWLDHSGERLAFDRQWGGSVSRGYSLVICRGSRAKSLMHPQSAEWVTFIAVIFCIFHHPQSHVNWSSVGSNILYHNYECD